MHLRGLRGCWGRALGARAEGGAWDSHVRPTFLGSVLPLTWDK